MKSKSLGLWTVALYPLMLVVSSIAYGFVSEYRAWPKIRQQFVASINSFRETNRVLMVSRTGLHDSATRNTIYQMGEALVVQARDCEGKQPADLRLRLIVPGSDWPEAPLVKRFVEDAEPYINRLDELLRDEADPSSVLGPLYRSSINDQAGSILELYFRYSLYNRNSDNAKRALMLMGKVALGYSTDTNAQDQQQFMGGCEQIYSVLSGTLRFDFWTSQELDDLSALILKPLDIPARLQASKKHFPEFFALRVAQTCNLQGFGIDDKFETVHRTMGVDSLYLERLFEASRIDDGIQNEGDLTNSIPILNRPWLSVRRQIPSTAVFSVSLPMRPMRVDERSELTANARLAYELGALEEIRRTTLLAVSVKQFQMREKRWPTSLKELSTVDENLHLNNVDGNPIEYDAPRDNVVAGALVSNVTSSFLQSNLSKRSFAHWLTKYYSFPLAIPIK